MTTIPLNQLTMAKGNVRKTGAKDGIEELAASIAAHGLLTSLTVRQGAGGKHAVIAGQRRLAALRLLAERGELAADHSVLCTVLEGDANAAEIGLAENVVRLAMHPADQFTAFAALIDRGESVTDIAARFGVSEATIAKRLKLGRVSKRILDAYREGDIGLEQVQAFALSDDREAQERVFAAFHGHRVDPRAIRRALTEGEVPATDPRLCFIGLAAYAAAGGAVRRDLFDGEHEGYAQDAALLDRLVAEKLAVLAEPIRAEGWGWVEARSSFDYADFRNFRRIAGDEVGLPDAEAAELDRLRDEYRALLESEYGDAGEEGSADTDRLEAMEQRIEELEDAAYAWTPEQMAVAGAVIYLSGDGKAEIERGLVREDGAPEEEAAAKTAEAEAEPPSPAPSLPWAVVADLTARKTGALRATLAQQPDVALAAVAHALARRAFYTFGGDTCLDITVKQRLLTSHLAEKDACGGSFAFDAERGKWVDRLPGDADDLWNWCLRQTQDTLLDLLAVAAAHTVDAVREKHTPEDAPRLLHAEALAEALRFDMHAWFMPTAANYFGRVNRTFIMDALTEAGRPARTRTWSKLKRPELAALAEREILGTGWLPEPLRKKADPVQSEAGQTNMAAAAAA